MQTKDYKSYLFNWRCPDWLTLNLLNKAIRSKVKTACKKVEAAVTAADKAAAQTALVAAISEINKACTKGVYHKNTASRKVSRLSKAVNAMA